MVKGGGRSKNFLLSNGRVVVVVVSARARSGGDGVYSVLWLVGPPHRPIELPLWGHTPLGHWKILSGHEIL